MKKTLPFLFLVLLFAIMAKLAPQAKEPAWLFLANAFSSALLSILIWLGYKGLSWLLAKWVPRQYQEGIRTLNFVLMILILNLAFLMATVRCAIGGWGWGAAGMLTYPIMTIMLFWAFEPVEKKEIHENTNYDGFACTGH